jgi:hypothetical protein
LPPEYTDLDIVLGKIAYRKISGTVIHFKNLEYSDSVLATIKPNLKKDEGIKIKYDPTDLGMIYVYDAFWSRYVPVPAVDQEYAKGLTEWQHEVICKFIRRTNQARINRKALVEAKEYIRQKIAEAFGRKPKKLKSAGRITKWMAFEDPAEVKIIYHSKNGKKLQSNGSSDENFEGDSPKLLGSGDELIYSSEEQSNQPLEWSEDERWESFYADFKEED